MQPPKLWRCLAQHVLRLDERHSWTWWRALTAARWQDSAAWREQFLAFAHREGHTSAEDVEAFFRAHATPHRLVALIEDLIAERILLRRDGSRLEEQVLRLVQADGQWK